MSIEKFLDLSTAYMTEKDSTRLREAGKGRKKTPTTNLPRIINHEYGFWVNVQQDPEVFVDQAAALVDAGFSAAFIKVIVHARKKGCWWINFDQDGPTDLKGFRRFSW